MSFFFSKRRIKESALKVQLGLSIIRLNNTIRKEQELVKRQKKDVAALLKDDKESKARIRVESVIRKDYRIEAMELIEMWAELLKERLPHLCKYVDDEGHAKCPPTLVEPVCTIIWASDYLSIDIRELNEVKKIFVKGFGKEFSKMALENINDCVNPKIIKNLSVAPPSTYLVIEYLKQIAKIYSVKWKPSIDDDALLSDEGLKAMSAPKGNDIHNRMATELEKKHPGAKANSQNKKPHHHSLEVTVTTKKKTDEASNPKENKSNDTNNSSGTNSANCGVSSGGTCPHCNGQNGEGGQQTSNQSKNANDSLKQTTVDVDLNVNLNIDKRPPPSTGTGKTKTKTKSENNQDRKAGEQGDGGPHGDGLTMDELEARFNRLSENVSSLENQQQSGHESTKPDDGDENGSIGFANNDSEVSKNSDDGETGGNDLQSRLARLRM